MGKPFQGRMLLSLLPVAIILILGLVLLNACGQGNPAGSNVNPIASAPQPTGPASTTAIPRLLSVSKSTPASITITVNPPDPKQKYTLYMSDVLKIDASTSAKVPINSSNSYTLNLDPAKTYMFVLVMEIPNKVGVSPVLAYIISKPGKNNKSRMNLIKEDAVPGTRTPNATKPISTPQMLTAPAQQCGYYSTYYEQEWKLELISGGYFPVFNYIKSVGPVFEVTTLNYATISPIPFPPFPDSACYNIAGGWDPWAPVQSCYYDYRFIGFGSSWYVPCGPQPTTITITPPTATIPVGGTQQFTATGVFPDGSVSDITLQAAWGINCTPDNELGIARIDETGLATGRNPGSCEVTATLENVTSPPATLIVGSVTINVSPASATAYLHPTPTHPQFSATDSNNNDVTNTAQWSVNPPGYATIAAGLVTPTKPGEASVTAALLDGSGNVTASGGASLEVMCRNYPHLRQNVGSWKDLPFANYTNKGTLIVDYGVYSQSIGELGCHITALSMAFNGMGFLVYPNGLDSWLKDPANDGYTIRNAPRDKAIMAFGRGTITAISDWHYGTLANASQTIKSELSKCNIVIAYVHGNTWLPAKNRYAFPEHYILIVKEKDNNIKIYDPWWRNGDQTPQLDNIQDHYTLMGYKTITSIN